MRPLFELPSKVFFLACISMLSLTLPLLINCDRPVIELGFALCLTLPVYRSPCIV